MEGYGKDLFSDEARCRVLNGVLALARWMELGVDESVEMYTKIRECRRVLIYDSPTTVRTVGESILSEKA
jgi:hypothetical protein